MTDRTADLMAASVSGTPLPPGEYGFVAPLLLGAGRMLRGASRDTTILRPMTATSGPLVIVGTVYTPLRGGLETLAIRATGTGLGIVVRGNNLRFRDVDVTECQTGVRLETSVDVAFTDCRFWRNECNIHALGDGTGTISVTTTRFHDCNIREAFWTGCYIEQAWGLVLDCCIVESNASAGVEVRSYPLANPPNAPSVDQINFRDTWIENNPAGAIVAWNGDRSAVIASTPFVTEYNPRHF